LKVIEKYESYATENDVFNAEARTFFNENALKGTLFTRTSSFLGSYRFASSAQSASSSLVSGKPKDVRPSGGEMPAALLCKPFFTSYASSSRKCDGTHGAERKRRS
jgi:hypothetical protein